MPILSLFDKLISPEIPGSAPVSRPAASSKVNFEQRKEQVDLLCTAELDIARERCRKKVDAIIRDCRARNCRYRDIEFDLEGDQERCLYGLNPPKWSPELGVLPPSRPSDVLRVTQIFEEPEFFIDGANSSDVAQGGLGDCWFLSAVSTVATMEGLINRICVHRDEQVGVYGFLFYRDSGWVDIIIDDLLYTRIPKFEELFDAQQEIYHYDKDKFDARARVGGKTLYFSRSKTENETWLPLLEKAYAKMYGDYEALNYGWNSEAIEGMTGGISNIIYVKDILDTERFWQEELLNANKDRLFGCFIMDSHEEVNGLFAAHAYSVLEALEVNGKRFLRIRNPWGDSEWKGAWSDGSKEWTGDWLTRLPELHHKFGEDGEFLMEYKDFLKTWSQIERSRLFDTGWKLSSMWLNVTSRTYPCAWSFGDVSFTFSITKDSPAAIVLSQLNDRYFTDISGYHAWSMDFVVYRAGAPAEEPYTRSSHTLFWRRTVSVELGNLEKGDYVLHVRLDREQKSDRKKTYYQDSLENWDARKLSKVLTQAAISKSIAINFDPEPHSDYLPAPDDLFGGEDLSSLQEKQIGLEVPVPTTAGESNTALTATDAPNSSAPNSKPEEATSKIDRLASNEKEGSGTTEGKVDNKTGRNPEINGNVKANEHAGVEAKGESEKKDGEDDALVVVKGADLAQASKVVHEGFMCKECKTSPIEGSWYRCLDSACLSYNICEKCTKSKPGSHDKTHKLLYLQTAEDSKKLKDQLKEGEDNSVTLGLRIYTKGESAVTIGGQLRHGNIIHWKRKDRD
ncbi:Calpain-1 catalytic subunit [Rhizoctonia solani AG-1 IB]|uniref:Calpain-1 catalytic subunit n=1 Tax=Thanatephorus cucumeris (strain AG1-IB / isolate 7/3/14) TaxID=1108050 RepID=M5CG70_THACB|nr:Calpain-1 catalytic subunit [Rhizoctonia solani AG-1 IB]